MILTADFGQRAGENAFGFGALLWIWNQVPPHIWKSMRRGRSTAITGLCRLLAVLAAVQTGAAAPAIVILHSYDESYFWTRSISEGIRSILEPESLDLRFEYMDTRRFGGPDYLSQLERLYRFKYGEASPDVVMVADDRALEFVLSRRSQLFSGTPLVFCGINQPEQHDLAGGAPITGIVELPDLRSDLEAIRRLHPEASRAKLFYAPDSPRAVLDTLRQAAREYGSLEEFQGIRLAEFVNQLRNSGPDSVLLVLDEPPEWPLLQPQDREVLKRSAAPVYFLWTTPENLPMTDGALGVAVVSGREQGISAARMALSIVNGAEAADIPVIGRSTHSFRFDSRRMGQFGIGEASLPPEAQVFNRPVLLPGIHTAWFWGVAGFALVQTALIAALLIALYQRRRAERERAHLEEELRQAQKMEAVGQLAGGIAHDFNNLLQAILGFADMALSGSTPGQQVHRDLLEVRKAANRAALLTRQLLAFSRRQLLQPSDLEVNQLIADFTGTVRRLVGDQVEFVFQRSTEPARVRADRTMLEQVLLNLVVNARDAMPNGGRLQIRTRRISFNESFCAVNTWARPGRFVELTVKDTGVGMPPEVLARVFEPFFTTKGQGHGTGLGLAMVYGVVKQHDGLIQVTSHQGRGTEFRIFLPRSEDVTASTGVETPVEHPETVRPDLDAGAILVAEDEDMVRNLAVRFLQGSGYQVLEARDGEEAMTLLEQEGDRIGLCILDVLMPGRSGLQLADYIRANHPKMKVLLSSGFTEGELPQCDEQLQLIEKPYSPQALLDQVRRMMRTE